MLPSPFPGARSPRARPPRSCPAPPRSLALALAVPWLASGWLENVPGWGHLRPRHSLVQSAAPSSPGSCVGLPQGAGCGPCFVPCSPSLFPGPPG